MGRFYVVIDQRGEKKCFFLDKPSVYQHPTGQARPVWAGLPVDARVNTQRCTVQSKVLNVMQTCAHPWELLPSSITALRSCEWPAATATSMLISLTRLPVTSCFSSCSFFSPVHLGELSSFRCAPLGPASQDFVLKVCDTYKRSSVGNGLHLCFYFIYIWLKKMKEGQGSLTRKLCAQDVWCTLRKTCLTCQWDS